MLVLAALGGCGRVNLVAPDGGSDNVTLTAVGGTDVPAGASIVIQVAGGPGAAIALTTTAGTLRAAAGASEAPSLNVVADGVGRASLQLRVPLASAPGTKIALSSDVALAGDRELTVIAPALAPSGDFSVARGFRVESAGSSADLVGREVRMAYSPGLSNFARALYVVGGARGDSDAPVVVRFFSNGLPPAVLATTGTGPARDVSQLAFATNTQFGDVLFACSASGSMGDGIFTLTQNTWAPWGAGFQNCNGLALDRDKVLGDPMLGDPSLVPMYLNLGGQRTLRVQDASNAVELDSKLPYGDAGWLWYMHPATAFPAGAYLIYSLATGVPDGKLWYLPAASPFAPQSLLDPLDSPTAAAFTAPDSRYGDLLFLASRETGVVSVVRPDRSTFEFLRGLGRTPDLTLGEAGELLTFDTVRGQLLRIVPEP